MKNFIFVSDFDGTLSNKDFYWMIIDDFIPEEGKELYNQWTNNKFDDYEFLSTIFQSTNLSEQELDDFISKIPIDEGAMDLLNEIQQIKGDFAILSAGCSYYIERFFKQQNISDIPIYSNKGVYENGGIKLVIDINSPFYSKVYGIDKSKVINHLKKEYKKVYFAGDSAPDVPAAKIADLVFAKNTLQNLLKKENIPFIPVDSFTDIKDYMKKTGVL